MDRRRAAGDQSQQDSEKTFLDKNGVKELLSDMVAQLAANRPSNPFVFMASYFEQSTVTQANKVEKSADLLTLTHHSLPAYQRNVYKAYELLSTHKVSKNLTGVNGAVFGNVLDLLLRLDSEGRGYSVHRRAANSLLTLIEGEINHVLKELSEQPYQSYPCSPANPYAITIVNLKDVPLKCSVMIKQSLDIRPLDSISFSAFNRAVTYIFIVKDYLKMAKSLYNLLDTNLSNAVEKRQAEALVSLLAKSLSSKSSRASSNSDLESCFLLSPQNVHKVMLESRGQSGGKTTLTEQEFTELVITTISPMISES